MCRQRGRVLLVLHGQRERLRLDKVAGRIEADHLLIRAARGQQVAFRGLALRGCAGQRRLGLRHVGAGDLAHPEPVVGRLELLGQHLLVVDVERQELLRLDDADIGVDHIAEAGLFLRQQGGALGHHLVLGRLTFADVLPPV